MYRLYKVCKGKKVPIMCKDMGKMVEVEQVYKWSTKRVDLILGMRNW